MNFSPTHPSPQTQNPEPQLRRYHSFLLRIWREDESTPWRIQIENPHTEEVIGFPSLSKLKIFLDEQFPVKGGDGAVI